ncbi:uncharacterized protein LOC113859430 [Abrus precatorius]|uniref:Uncharacterized protein LOC113859430 n=1 Tax=Abrus precatorius TaxID=3816 RepID=A0A8B8L051_ABRPR|nr:uncharacterized protein LOC113859430 [Abrus precatorius]
MNGFEASKLDDLIRGKCSMKDKLINVLFDSGATHFFISLGHLDIVLEIDWLSSNHVLLNCKEKTLIFDTGMQENSKFLSKGDSRNMINAKAFMVLFSSEVKKSVEVEQIPVVNGFLEVFPKDITELLLKREIKFTIDLTLKASPISIAPYRMSPVELVEVKKQVEDSLQKQFVRPSVSP